MDERCDKLDDKIIRVTFSVVEILDGPETNTLKTELQPIKENLNKNQKFHFADIDDPMREKILTIIAEQGIRCKMYIFYALDCSELNAKVTALIWAIENTKKSLSKRYTLNFLIENANEYKSIIRESNLIDDTLLTIIPDAFCHVFARRLNRVDCLKQYNIISDKIRLESYLVKNCCTRKMRADKLEKI